jgi:hypothetical protein
VVGLVSVGGPHTDVKQGPSEGNNTYAPAVWVVGEGPLGCGYPQGHSNDTNCEKFFHTKSPYVVCKLSLLGKQRLRFAGLGWENLTRRAGLDLCRLRRSKNCLGYHLLFINLLIFDLSVKHIYIPTFLICQANLLFF